MPAFLLTPTIKIVALLAIVALIWGHGFKTGSNHVQTQWDAQVTQGAVRSVRIVQRVEVVKQKIVEKFIKEEGETKVITDTIVKEVPVYVGKDADFVLNNGTVRVWNAANSMSPVPLAPDRTDEAPSGVTIIEAVTNHTEVASICTQTAQQLTDLQDFIREVERINNKEAP